MKKLVLVISLAIAAITIGTSHSQTKAEIRAANKAANTAIRVATTDSLLSRGKYQFAPKIVNTTTGSNPSVNIAGAGYGLQVTPELIVSQLPYYGKAQSGSMYSSDNTYPLSFQSEDFTIEKSEKTKKKETLTIIKIKIRRGGKPTADLTLEVAPNGDATLLITRADISRISFSGTIEPLVKQ